VWESGTFFADFYAALQEDVDAAFAPRHIKTAVSNLAVKVTAFTANASELPINFKFVVILPVGVSCDGVTVSYAACERLIDEAAYSRVRNLIRETLVAQDTLACGVMLMFLQIIPVCVIVYAVVCAIFGIPVADDTDGKEEDSGSGIVVIDEGDAIVGTSGAESLVVRGHAYAPLPMDDVEEDCYVGEIDIDVGQHVADGSYVAASTGATEKVVPFPFAKF